MTEPAAREPVRVLLVEDDDDHAELMEYAFSRSGGWALRRAATVAAARALLRDEPFGLVVTDYRLPDGEGLSILARDGRGEPLFPVIVMTSQGSEAVAAESIKRGALDYLVKSPETFARLPEHARIALRAWDAERERAEARRGLERSLAEKVVLLREVHHRVKNNFQVIASLLSLQSARQGEGPVRDALSVVENRVRSMALVHEMLYEEGDFSRIDFAEFVDAAATRSTPAREAALRGVTVRLELEKAELSLDEAVPLALAFNELLSNALSHAYPRGETGAVEASVARGVSEIRLGVVDRGRGLPPGLDPARPTTLGFRLLDVLARQAGATWSVVSEPGRGVAAFITLPAPRS